MDSESTPLCFTQLLGHDKAKKMLSRSLTLKRIPHGFLFRGDGGVGKSLFGRGLAAAINCRDINRIGACGICSSCKKFRSMNHPDFVVVRPEKGVIKINQIRDLAKELSFPPYESPMRVVVIEDVHTMRQEAANALLKTLEEPPKDNLLILVADSSREILSTLTSRCQVVPFNRLNFQQTTTVLRRQGVEDERAEMLATLAEGSPGRALLLNETELVDIWVEVVTFLSASGVDVDRDTTKLLRLAEKVAAVKDDLGLLLGLFRLWLRDQLLGDNRNVKLFSGDTKRKSWSSSELFDKLNSIDRAEQELQRNCNKNLVCEVLLFNLQ